MLLHAVGHLVVLLDRLEDVRKAYGWSFDDPQRQREVLRGQADVEHLSYWSYDPDAVVRPGCEC